MSQTSPPVSNQRHKVNVTPLQSPLPILTVNPSPPIRNDASYTKNESKNSGTVLIQSMQGEEKHVNQSTQQHHQQSRSSLVRRRQQIDNSFSILSPQQPSPPLTQPPNPQHPQRPQVTRPTMAQRTVMLYSANAQTPRSTMTQRPASDQRASSRYANSQSLVTPPSSVTPVSPRVLRRLEAVSHPEVGGVAHRIPPRVRRILQKLPQHNRKSNK